MIRDNMTSSGGGYNLDAAEDGDPRLMQRDANRRSDKRALISNNGHNALPQVIVDPEKDRDEFNRHFGNAGPPPTLSPSTPGMGDPEVKALISAQRAGSLDFGAAQIPKDKCFGVYLILLIHGVGTLMPWNMFITARDYFVIHKLGGSDSDYGKNFLIYLGVCSQVPNLILGLINLFIQVSGSLTKRMVLCLIINTIIFIVTIALAMVDSSTWELEFFYLTMISVVILNSANGVYQNSVYGLAADLPMKYTNAVVLGTNISGTFVSVLNLLTRSLADLKIGAIYYFITALLVLLICFDTYFCLPFSRFYRYFHEVGQIQRCREMKDRNTFARTRNQTCFSSFLTTLRPYIQVVRKAWVAMFNVFFVFFVTLTIFPAMQTDIKIYSGTTNIPEDLFTGVTCFLLFNVTAMIGNIVANFIQFPGPRFLWIPVLLRGLLIPFFMFCNFRPKLRTFDVYITEDWGYVAGGVTMGFTSGYLSSLAMMYAPRVVESERARVAGMMAAFFLIFGIVAGVNFTLPMAYIIENLGPLTPLGQNATVTA